MSLNVLEEFLIRKSQRELIDWCIGEHLILNERLCHHCNVNNKFVSYTRNDDKFAWRCMTKTCVQYKKYVSIRLGTFFEPFNKPLLLILKVILRYSTKTSRNSMILHFGEVYRGLIFKICDRIVDYMPICDFSSHKLGGPGKIVQIDETMMNYKCKSHRGRSPLNRSDALCIVEVDNKITRAFATIIADKKSETFIPIICSQVASNSIIWTNEHRSYNRLPNFNFTHGTVCHKYEFINSITLVNTQAVESFNNIIKCELKIEKESLQTKEKNF